MKTAFVTTPSSSLHVFILAAAAITMSCSRGGEATAPSAQTAPTQTQLSAATGITHGLARNEVPASCFLDNLGTVENPAAQKSVRVAGDKDLLFSGWAIDNHIKTLAGGVDVVIDRTPYNAKYGIDRSDVATHFGNPAYQKSGFQLIMLPGQLPKGQHSVTVRDRAGQEILL
jgi:hypothetical protein